MTEADDIRERFNRRRDSYVRIYRKASTLDGDFTAKELREIADAMDRLQEIEPNGDTGFSGDQEETKSGSPGHRFFLRRDLRPRPHPEQSGNGNDFVSDN